MDIQKSIIGAIILNADVLLSVTDIISPEDMTQVNGIILTHAINLYTDGKPVDLASLSHSLKASHELNTVGGTKYLVECADTPTSANAAYHSNLVKDSSMKGKIKEFGKSIALREFACDADEAIGTIESEILELADKTKPKKSPDVADIIQSIEERQAKIDHSIETGEDAGLWIPTAFFGGDIPGYYRGHFWTVTGYTSYGKSLLLSSMLVDICQNGGKPLVFSLEDSREEKVMGMKAVIADVPKSWQLQGDVQSSRESLKLADDDLLKWKPVIYDDVRNLEDMRLKIKKHVLKDNIDIVAIDYIQQITDKGSLYERMSKAAIFLQSTFKELGVTGIVLSQIDNVSARDGGQIIGAKGGGDIPAASDIVIDINRDKEAERKVNLIIKKNRAFGKTGVRPCMFTSRWTAIEPVEPF